MSLQTYPAREIDLLYYLHIPKTAGTSFTDFISKQFAPNESNSPQHISRFLKSTTEELARYKFVAGHFFYNIDTVVQRKPLYITMLRDPVERTISHYAHVRRSPSHYAYDVVQSQSLLDFATDPRTIPLYANMQTRYIGLDFNIPEVAAQVEKESKEELALERYLESYAPNGYFDPALLEKAQQRLNDFAFVGLAEYFNQSVQLLAYTFGWESSAEIPTLNVGVNRPAPTDIQKEAIDVIRKNTELSYTLYEQAKKLFEERYNQLVELHPERQLQKITSNQSSVFYFQNQVTTQQRIIDQLKAQVTYLETTNAALSAQNQYYAAENNRLAGIETSFAWRLVARAATVRRKLIPLGSKRERFYLKLLGRSSTSG